MSKSSASINRSKICQSGCCHIVLWSRSISSTGILILFFSPLSLYYCVLWNQYILLLFTKETVRPRNNLIITVVWRSRMKIHVLLLIEKGPCEKKNHLWICCHSTRHHLAFECRQSLFARKVEKYRIVYGVKLIADTFRCTFITTNSNRKREKGTQTMRIL
jgi:hypothetical protein